MQHKVIYYLGLLPFMLLISSCQNNASKEVTVNLEETSPANEAIEVSTQQFAQAKMELGAFLMQPFATSIRSTGKIEIPATNQISISAYAGGYVSKFDVIPGQSIRKGQRLFSLENPAFVEMQQSYLETKAQIGYLKSDYERQKTLTEENVAAEKNLGQAESLYQTSIAKLEGLKKRLQLININPEQVTPENLRSSITVYAPNSGFVTEVHARQGMFLNPTDVAIELINTDHLHLELFVFEKDILKIKKGQKVQFRLPEASTANYEAEIYLIGKLLDEESRVVQVHAHLHEEAEKSIQIAGMYVEADIILEEQASKSLPEEAIVYEDEQAYVLVQKSQTDQTLYFELRSVQLGLQQKGMVQVLNAKDFTAADQILVKGAFNLVGIE
jgi:cobalt-zinc-cadmium efflux system membrane fusion protein